MIKNLFSLRLPVLGADREWNAIHRLQELGVDTMHGVGFGQQGLNPLNRISFIITEDLSPAVSLEDYCADWLANPPSRKIKMALIERLAVMVLITVIAISATSYCINRPILKVMRLNSRLLIYTGLR